MNRFIVIRIPFNNRPYNEKRLTKEWLNDRLDIFNKYTLQGFKKQTNQEFEVVLECDPRSLDTINEIVSEKMELPSNIHFGTLIKNDPRIMKKLEQYAYVYEVRIDSDNIYHPEFIQRLYDYNPKTETEAIICQNGYIYNCHTDCLASIFGESLSFYALLYKIPDYVQGKYYSLMGGHSKVRFLKYEPLPGNNYLITVHGKNVLIDNKFMDKQKGKVIEGKEKESVLRKFGIIK